ncbi:hypothetical protein, partial [Hyphomonas sp.]|uniref:hypothetical protein n=1 Tax=Hyphomonas sp. TaxID=87 RepID=UPI0032993239
EKHDVIGFDGLFDGIERGLIGHSGISAVASACVVDTRQRQALMLPGRCSLTSHSFRWRSDPSGKA